MLERIPSYFSNAHKYCAVLAEVCSRALHVYSFACTSATAIVKTLSLHQRVRVFPFC